MKLASLKNHTCGGKLEAVPDSLFALQLALHARKSAEVAVIISRTRVDIPKYQVDSKL